LTSFLTETPVRIKDTEVETRFSVAKGGPKRSAFGKSEQRRNQFRFHSK